MGGPAEMQGDRDFAGEISVGSGGNRKKRAFAFLEEGAVLVFDKGEPPAAGSEGDRSPASG